MSRAQPLPTQLAEAHVRARRHLDLAETPSGGTSPFLCCTDFGEERSRLDSIAHLKLFINPRFSFRCQREDTGPKPGVRGYASLEPLIPAQNQEATSCGGER